MSGLSQAAIAACGLCVGVACGFAVRRAKLCSYAAIESALIGGDWRRMRVFGLALAVAVAGAQALALSGLLDPASTTYLWDRVPILSILVGSTMFGLGMSLVGTCAFGSLVRLGGGDLRSLVTMMVFGAVAYATLRGALSGLRGALEHVAAPTPGGVPSSLAAIGGAWLGADLRLAVSAVLVVALVAAAARDRRLLRMPRMLAAGLALGLGVVAGWAATGLADSFEAAQRPQSLTFVAPVARTLYAGLLGASAWLDFGVGSVVGVAVGAFAAARFGDDFRWEAFDDHYEMRRHLAGAALMGFGGVLAGGCTIGQGLTAGSLLAASAPLALLGMAAGARLGMAVLVEGSLIDVVRQRARLWFGPADPAP